MFLSRLAIGLCGSWYGNCLFGAIPYINLPSFYQDRLGTNIGKTRQKRLCVVLQKVGGDAPPRSTCMAGANKLSFPYVCPEPVVVK
jgi:hypothetical protein